jgi:hypothetical protein
MKHRISPLSTLLLLTLAAYALIAYLMVAIERLPVPVDYAPAIQDMQTQIDGLEDLIERIQTLEWQIQQKDRMILYLNGRIDRMTQNYEIWGIYLDEQSARQMKQYMKEHGE